VEEVGGFKGGSRGGGSRGSYNSMNKPRSGSNFRSNAMSFGAGALGGMAAYSLMRSMSGSYHPGYYEPGYGSGETCVNNEDLNGTKFGSFRCPLNGFPYEAKYCCGEYGKQYCCIREGSSRLMRGTSSLAWIFLVIIICLIVIFLFAKHRRQRNSVIMIPMEPPADEQPGPHFYRPPPPPMGYPPPPTGNPYAVPPQNFEGNFNPYLQQHQMPYPPQQQAYNPYQVKESGPPAYNDVFQHNQQVPTTKPI